MEQKNDNFDWIDKVAINTKIARTLIDHCKKIKPIWTEELDLAVRIIFHATNGNLTSRKVNETCSTIIEGLIAKNRLCNTDVIEIAAELLMSPYFCINQNTIESITKKHCEIVKKSYAQLCIDRKEYWQSKIDVAMPTTV